MLSSEVIIFINKIPASYEARVLSWNSKEQLDTYQVLLGRDLQIEDFKLRAASYLFQFIDLSLFEDSELEAVCQLKLDSVSGSVDPYLQLLFKHYQYHNSEQLKQILLGLLNYGG